MSRYIDLDQIEFLKVDGNKEFNHGVDCCINTLLRAEPIKAIPIQERATNGDMIKTMFPDADLIEFMGTITVDIPKHGAKCRQKIRFDLDWWNAPYKKEGQECSE